MRHLVRLVSLRHLQVDRGRSLLTVVGIVLGVAVIFAVEVVNASVIGAVRKSVTETSGKTQLSVGSGVGVSEDALELVRGVAGVAAAVPIIGVALVSFVRSAGRAASTGSTRTPMNSAMVSVAMSYGRIGEPSRSRV